MIRAASLLLVAMLVAVGCNSTDRSVVQIDPTVVAVDCGPNMVATTAQYERVLAKYVGDDGRVDYVGLIADKPARRALDCFLAATPYSSGAYTGHSDMLTADFINRYNASVIRGVTLGRELGQLPDSPDKLVVKIPVDAAAPLARRDRDWRIIFALGNPARYGPKLPNKLYTAEQLDDQLDQAVQDYLGSCAGLKIDHAGRRALFGELIWQRRDWFVTEYQRRYGIEVSLLSAVIPWAGPCVQEQLADVPGYKAHRLEQDDRLLEVDAYAARYDEQDDPEVSYTCGCSAH